MLKAIWCRLFHWRYHIERHHNWPWSSRWACLHCRHKWTEDEPT